MNAEEVRQAVTVDGAWRHALQESWLQLISLAVWGEVKSGRLGAMGRMRRRVLEVGEKLDSLCASRDWIPHPREQLKNALGSSLALRDALQQLQRAMQDVDGGTDLDAFVAALAALEARLDERLPELENRWAELLDSQYGEDDDADE